MGVALVPTLSGWAARVGRITTPPNSKDYVGGLHCMCACVWNAKCDKNREGEIAR